MKKLYLILILQLLVLVGIVILTCTKEAALITRIIRTAIVALMGFILGINYSIVRMYQKGK